MIEYATNCWEQYKNLIVQDGPIYKPLIEKDIRSDIQVLRCLAVMMVVLFHLDIPFFSGGFIGVDVFFAISGYLVVGSIFKSCLSNKFNYFIFLANRIKRLLPASTICLVFIILLFLLFPNVQRAAGNQGWYDIVWASLHGANIHYYTNENQYFRADNTVSFTLHYWSLALEEQFYLVFPFIFYIYYKLLNCVEITDKDPIKFNTGCITIFTVSMGISSLILCIIPYQLHVIGVSTPFKFFLLPARLWEFLLGGLIALHQDSITEYVITPIIQKCGVNVLHYTQWICILLLIGFSVFLPSQNYPNHWTVCIIILTCYIMAVDLPINNEALELIGNWSYSIYLYHFPIIQLFKTFDLAWFLDISEVYLFPAKFFVIITLTLLCAMISFYIIEQKSLRINISPLVWYIILIVSSLVIAGIAVLLFHPPFLILSTPIHTNTSFYDTSNIYNIHNISLQQAALLKYNVNVAAHTGFLGDNINKYISKKLEFTYTQLTNSSSKCLLLYGDSNMVQWLPAIFRLANTINIDTIFFADSYDRYGTGQVYDEREIEEYKTHSLMHLQFLQCTSVISIFARTSMHLFAYNNEQKDQLIKRVISLTNYFSKYGPVILMEGIPRQPGEHNPNKCLDREIYNNLRDNVKFNAIKLPLNNSIVLPADKDNDIVNVKFMTVCSMNKNTSVFDYSIFQSSLSSNTTILSMNKYLCINNIDTNNVGICPVNYYDIPVYMDQTHLSEAIVYFLSATFADEVLHILKK